MPVDQSDGQECPSYVCGDDRVNASRKPGLPGRFLGPLPPCPPVLPVVHNRDQSNEPRGAREDTGSEENSFYQDAGRASATGPARTLGGYGEMGC